MRRKNSSLKEFQAHQVASHHQRIAKIKLFLRRIFLYKNQLTWGNSLLKRRLEGTHRFRFCRGLSLVIRGEYILISIEIKKFSTWSGEYLHFFVR